MREGGDQERRSVDEFEEETENLGYVFIFKARWNEVG